MNAEDLLAEFTARLPLADVVARRVALRRVGKYLTGACPFSRGDETACSFYVYKDHFHCFSCGAHGDHVTFLMHTKGIGIEAAIREIASEAGVEIPEPLLSELSMKIGRWKTPP